MEAALAMAAQIASKSPVAVQGTKDNLNFSRSDLCDYCVVVVETKGREEIYVKMIYRDGTHKKVIGNMIIYKRWFKI